MKRDWKLIIQIFLTFLRIGPVTFGGGYAMIPVIEREVVVKRGWVKPQDVTDVFAIAQSVPGAIALNSATFIGYTIAGVVGAIAALIGVLLPTFIIVIVLSIFYLSFHGNPFVDAAFHGMSAAIVALIVYAAIKIGRTAVFDKTTLITAGVTVFVLYFLKVHPIIIIGLGMLIGIMQIKGKEILGLAVYMEKEEAKKSEETNDWTTV
ncbi:MAG: chromate transporter [Paenibacillus sp.]|uniref:chromate transporter n=1 Tax=Paenibacillus sp. TaxID=58172 RepID=UPI0025EABAB4|nr:chromate transporter [Paenibacillus sp.]MBR2566078.1 chromate transporter [Paenibacillus sp.]